jgi:hypothetical protein
LVTFGEPMEYGLLRYRSQNLLQFIETKIRSMYVCINIRI